MVKRFWVNISNDHYISAFPIFDDYGNLIGGGSFDDVSDGVFCWVARSGYPTALEITSGVFWFELKEDRAVVYMVPKPNAIKVEVEDDATSE